MITGKHTYQQAFEYPENYYFHRSIQKYTLTSSSLYLNPIFRIHKYSNRSIITIDPQPMETQINNLCTKYVGFIGYFTFIRSKGNILTVIKKASISSLFMIFLMLLIT